MPPTPQSVAVRQVVPDDEAFLFEVYASNRGEDLLAMDWPHDRVMDFLANQYAAQRRFFEADYPQADDLIIQHEGNPIGRMVLARGNQEIRIVDMALLPQYCNLGIGTYLVEQLLSEARQSEKALCVQVMRANRAVALFERLGLVKTGETGSHYQMEWRADA